MGGVARDSLEGPLDIPGTKRTKHRAQSQRAPDLRKISLPTAHESLSRCGLCERATKPVTSAIEMELQVQCVEEILLPRMREALAVLRQKEAEQRSSIVETDEPKRSALKKEFGEFSADTEEKWLIMRRKASVIGARELGISPAGRSNNAQNAYYESARQFYEEHGYPISDLDSFTMYYQGSRIQPHLRPGSIALSYDHIEKSRAKLEKHFRLTLAEHARFLHTYGLHQFFDEEASKFMIREGFAAADAEADREERDRAAQPKTRGGSIMAFFRGLGRKKKDKRTLLQRSHSRKIDTALGKWQQLDDAALRRRRSEFQKELSKSCRFLGHTTGTVNFHQAYPKITPLTGDTPSQIILPPQVLRVHAQRKKQPSNDFLHPSGARSARPSPVQNDERPGEVRRHSMDATHVAPFVLASAAEEENSTDSIASASAAEGGDSCGGCMPKSARRPVPVSRPKSSIVLPENAADAYGELSEAT